MNLTQSERATYQSLRDRGFTHEEALEDALDGVEVETLRENNVRKPKPCEHQTQGSEQPDTCDYCAYLAKKYDGVEPWEDATWD